MVFMDSTVTFRKRGPRRRISDAMLQALLAEYREGTKTIQELADQYRYSRSYVHVLLKPYLPDTEVTAPTIKPTQDGAA